LNLADINKLQVGDHVVAIGSPLGLEGTVSDGIISAVREEGHAKWIQTTAPVSHGNSGGPLLNMGGSVVGVITWGVSLQEGQNLNFAIPSAEVNTLLSKPAVLLPLDSIGGIRQPTAQPRASGGNADKHPGEQETVKDDGGKQHAIDQLRTIADAIKKCPAGEIRQADGSGSHYYAPMNVVWDVERTQSYRSPEIGYIEFVTDYYSLPRTPTACKKNDRDCVAWNKARADVDMLLAAQPTRRLNRYEFDFGSHGLEFSRTLWKLEKDETGQWNSTILSTDCEDVAVKTALAAPAQ
jgi:hypothetical protein